MKILVTGASGFVGRFLCSRLVATGHHVVAAVREPRTHVDAAEVIATGDIGRRTDWPELEHCDAIVHLAAHVHRMHMTAGDGRRFHEVNVDGTARLVREASKHSVGRFVFLSTVKVHGELSEDEPITESTKVAPVDDYARSKAEAEEIVRQSGLPGVILRPPLVYGPGVGANFLSLMRAVARRRPLPLGRIRNGRSLVFVGNLVDAIVRALVVDTSSCETFLIGDGDAVSSPDLVRRLARALDVHPILIPVPVALLRLAGAAIGRSAEVDRLVSSLRIDDQAIRKAWGWHPPSSLDEGLKVTADWFRGENPQ